MTGKDIFKIWAPPRAKWTNWVRPVPFVVINDNLKINTIMDLRIPNINYLNEMQPNTALIIDLPECDSIQEGIAVTKFGFRPIPIYNGTIEQENSIPTTNNKVISYGLIWGASELEKINISDDAPPAFLLDSDRMNRLKMDISVFDNSWDLYDQDIPTADYFLKNNINKIIIRGEVIQKDLKKILYKYQKSGIKILFTNGYEKPKEVRIKKPLQKSTL